MSFIRFTSEGGYLGRFFWANTGSVGAPDTWGSWAVLRDPDKYWGTGWAGEIWVVRFYASYWRAK